MMSGLPLDIGTLHFVGIGGIGMSGIAEILHNLGYGVQGSDMAENANVKRLRDKGITVYTGHEPENLKDSRVLVISSAVKEDNPEVKEARKRMIPIVRRAEMLAELMRLKWSIAIGGTHGKTTTTSVIAALLDAADYDPTVINGGIINAYGTNARLGAGKWLVAEADESDGSFTKLPAYIAVVTNIDPEHLDFYGSFDALRDAFRTFVENIPFYGFACLCLDHPEVQALIGRVSDRRLVTFGFSPQADVQAVNVDYKPEGAFFDVSVKDRQTGDLSVIDGFYFPMHGKHNVQNALASIAIGLELQLPVETIKKALLNFEGVKRRFTHTGTEGGISVIDDYGHHPVEIAAALKAARSVATGKVLAVFQPHRYSRVADLFDDFCTCFNDADTVIVADIYSAGEQPIEGVDKDTLINGLRTHGHRHIVNMKTPDDLPVLVKEHAKDGDMVICLGAGTITNWANALPKLLREGA